MCFKRLAVFNVFTESISPDRLRIASDFIHLLYVIDEYTDVETATGVREISGIVLDAINNTDKPRPEGELIVGEMSRE